MGRAILASSNDEHRVSLKRRKVDLHTMWQPLDSNIVQERRAWSERAYWMSLYSEKKALVNCSESALKKSKTRTVGSNEGLPAAIMLRA